MPRRCCPHDHDDAAAAGHPLGQLHRAHVSVWDIRDNFGDTNLLVANMAQGRDLARCLGGDNVALMRGHGFAAAARSLIEVVRMSVYVPRNARALLAATGLGPVTPLSPGEIAARAAGYQPQSPETWRAWEYWAAARGLRASAVPAAGQIGQEAPPLTHASGRITSRSTRSGARS